MNTRENTNNEPIEVEAVQVEIADEMEQEVIESLPKKAVKAVKKGLKKAVPFVVTGIVSGVVGYALGKQSSLEDEEISEYAENEEEAEGVTMEYQPETEAEA